MIEITATEEEAEAVDINVVWEVKAGHFTATLTLGGNTLTLDSPAGADKDLCEVLVVNANEAITAAVEASQ